MRRLDDLSHHEAAGRLQAMEPSALSAPSAPVPRPPFRPYERALRLQHDVPWLAAKGIAATTARAYEAGAWRGQGMLAGCVAVRLHDPAVAPLGYAGRRLGGGGGEWVFPCGFPKSAVLYGHHRLRAAAPRIVVVECPWGVMRLAQLGVAAVALLGTTLSERHAHLLAERERVTLLLDGDDAGRRGAEAATRRLAGAVAVDIVTLPDGADPHDLNATPIARPASTIR